MSANPLISVIIPSYNCATYLTEAVRSALEQSYSPVEIIVVDDGSTDATSAVIGAFGERIRYIRQANGGVSRARNSGIRAARGQLIAFLDADDRWLPEKLTKQCAQLRADSRVPLVHTNIQLLYEPSGRQVHDSRDHARYSGRCYAQSFWGNAIITSTVLVTVGCLEEVGLFDEKTRYAEDYDLWIRIARRYPLAYLNESLVLYREHQTNASRNQHAMFEGEYYVLAKALAADPALTATLDSRRVRRRMFEAAFSAAYANLERGDLVRARHYFRLALQHAPARPGTWGLWLSTFLSPGARQKLQVLKRRLLSGSSDAPSG
ncbi:MAG: glycosyltransferase family 2 protein [Steroidobacteraceae bacterium]